MFRFFRPLWHRGYRPLGSHNTRSPPWRYLIVILVLLLLETLLHVHQLRVHGPEDPHDGDRPYQIGCALPDETKSRANATILMLARNSDTEDAFKAIDSLERHFNRWYKYPVLFLNNEPWDPHFIETLRNATSGETTFDVIPKHMWSYPEWIDEEKAKASVHEQDALINAGKESYHHMCRFYSGMFYDVPSVQKYRWFWRVEPHVDFTCSITYDPFVEMEKRDQKYGYTIALWEVGRTAPNLFRLVDEYRQKYLGLGNTELWKAMLDPAWVPWPFRRLLSYFSHHTASGDFWNFCHYWSNFEIADMDFFRSQQYRDFFDYLDRSGGFYFERFGDAPIHSLAAALFLEPRQIHHFEDVGYRHKNFWQQPNNAPGLQMPTANLSDHQSWAEEVEGAPGCRCEKSDWKISLETSNIAPTCFRRLGEAIKAH